MGEPLRRPPGEAVAQRRRLPALRRREGLVHDRAMQRAGGGEDHPELPLGVDDAEDLSLRVPLDEQELVAERQDQLGAGPANRTGAELLERRRGRLASKGQRVILTFSATLRPRVLERSLRWLDYPSNRRRSIPTAPRSRSR